MKSFKLLVSTLAFITLSAAAPSSPQTEDQETPFIPLQPNSDSYLFQSQGPQSVNPLAKQLQLPKEANSSPFFPPEPVTFLKAPGESSDPDYYAVPIPNQELIAPADTEWNPNNDPNLYYEVPAILTKQEVPTQEFPKKYNDEIHEKNKPLSSKPKEEIVLEPIDAETLEEKQRQLDKLLDKQAKKENKKIIKMLPPRQKKSDKKEIDQAPSQSANFDRGLSSDIIDSLGIPTNDNAAAASHDGSSSPGERVEFHMVGHDGPLSYKWGYDTGKGHNRLFRFEERDKEGLVTGHYGFYDKEGKLQVVHYDAHPHTGFHIKENS